METDFMYVQNIHELLIEQDRIIARLRADNDRLIKAHNECRETLIQAQKGAKSFREDLIYHLRGTVLDLPDRTIFDEIDTLVISRRNIKKFDDLRKTNSDLMCSRISEMSTEIMEKDKEIKKLNEATSNNNIILNAEQVDQLATSLANRIIDSMQNSITIYGTSELQNDK